MEPHTFQPKCTSPFQIRLKIIVHCRLTGKSSVKLMPDVRFDMIAIGIVFRRRCFLLTRSGGWDEQTIWSVAVGAAEGSNSADIFFFQFDKSVIDSRPSSCYISLFVRRNE